MIGEFRVAVFDASDHFSWRSGEKFLVGELLLGLRELTLDLLPLLLEPRPLGAVVDGRIVEEPEIKGPGTPHAG